MGFCNTRKTFDGYWHPEEIKWSTAGRRVRIWEICEVETPN